MGKKDEGGLELTEPLPEKETAQAQPEKPKRKRRGRPKKQEPDAINKDQVQAMLAGLLTGVVHTLDGAIGYDNADAASEAAFAESLASLVALYMPDEALSEKAMAAVMVAVTGAALYGPYILPAKQEQEPEQEKSQ